MIEMIRAIIDNGYGYVSNGNVYFSVKKFADYGKLSRQNLSEMRTGEQISIGEKGKENPEDFALWKSAKPQEPSWDSPWGKGRPGWHIECSAMATKYLGDEFDLHGGGIDLVFPHHENEIAQARASGKKFAKYWLHTGLLTVNGEKMSKSLGNVVTIRELLKKYDPEVIRFFFALSHYRSPPDFSYTAMEDAKKGLEKIRRARDLLERASGKADSAGLDKNALSDEEIKYLKEIEKFEEKFEFAMDDDFDLRKAIECMFNFVRETNNFLTKKRNPNLCAYALDTLTKIGNVLTIFQGEKGISDAILDKVAKLIEKYGKGKKKEKKEKNLDVLMESLIRIREESRKNKEWKKADSIRKELIDLGFEIHDTSTGTRWRLK
jgi:cysteinyl-tRNA synthetase